MAKDVEMKENQMKEAIKRIKALDFIENVLKDFKEGTVNKSERTGFPGILYWIDDEEKEMVKSWEDETGNLVYHVVKDNTKFGTMYSFLYISKYEDEWESDNIDLTKGMAIAFCLIGTDLDYGEYGSIGVRPINGGLERTF